jgi:hypothetical protein
MKLFGIYKSDMADIFRLAGAARPIDREARMVENGKRSVSGARAPRDTDAAARAIAEDLEAKARMEELLDEAIEETFPASDPISVAMPSRPVTK